jgi:hypothetical protein
MNPFQQAAQGHAGPLVRLTVKLNNEIERMKSDLRRQAEEAFAERVSQAFYTSEEIVDEVGRIHDESWRAAFHAGICRGPSLPVLMILEGATDKFVRQTLVTLYARRLHVRIENDIEKRGGDEGPAADAMRCFLDALAPSLAPFPTPGAGTEQITDDWWKRLRADGRSIPRRLFREGWPHSLEEALLMMLPESDMEDAATIVGADKQCLRPTLLGSDPDWRDNPWSQIFP